MVKKVTMIVGTLIVFTLSPTIISAKSVSKNIDVNPIGLILGAFQLRYQIGLQEKVSFDVVGVYINPFILDIDIQGAGGSLGLSWYYLRNIFDGPFFSLYLSASKTWTDEPDFIGAMGYGPIFLAGWQWRWSSGFNTSLGVSLGYVLSTEEEETWTDRYGNTWKKEVYGTGFQRSLLWTLGYAF